MAVGRLGWVLVFALFGFGACSSSAPPPERSAPRVTFSGPDYVTIKHDPIEAGFPPFEVMAMAERYCAASGKSAAVTPYGRYTNSTSFVCVEKGEQAK